LSSFPCFVFPWFLVDCSFYLSRMTGSAQTVLGPCSRAVLAYQRFSNRFSTHVQLR
jgi:hypothetical protein